MKKSDLRAQFEQGVRARQRTAFTLVEVLVVVVVLSILAALLLPVFNRVRQSGQNTVCQSNLRQLGLALELYTRDNNNFYPAMGAHLVGCSWGESLRSYIKDETIFTCPASPTQFYKAGCPDNLKENGVTYHYDGGYAFNLPEHDLYIKFPKSRVLRPTQLILVMDANFGGFTQSGREAKTTITDERVADMGLDFRHDQGLNALFADGHVKRLTRAQTVDNSLWTYSGRG